MSSKVTCISLSSLSCFVINDCIANCRLFRAIRASPSDVSASHFSVVSLIINLELETRRINSYFTIDNDKINFLTSAYNQCQ